MKMHVQHIMLWGFKNNKDTTETLKKLLCLWRPTPRLVFIFIFWWYIMKWWTQTRTFFRPWLREFLECNLCKSTWPPTHLNPQCSSTILKNIGKLNKLIILVSHTLCKKNKEDCIFRETSLFSWERNDLFL